MSINKQQQKLLLVEKSSDCMIAHEKINVPLHIPFLEFIHMV